MDIAQYKPDPHFAKAIDLWHDKQFLKAHIEFSIVPDNAGEQRAMAAYYNARCLEILKQTGEAEVWYEGALERDPQLARAYLGLARLQVARGDMVKGFTNQMRAYELDPRLRDVDYALGD